MGSDHQYSFEKLNVWQNARKLSLKIYQITEKFPQDEKYGLTNQIRRAAVSIPANISEGTSRLSSKDQAHYTNIAYSSLMELLSHLYIALDLNYIDEIKFNELKLKIYEISNQLNSLHKSQLNKNSSTTKQLNT